MNQSSFPSSQLFATQYQIPHQTTHQKLEKLFQISSNLKQKLGKYRICDQNTGGQFYVSEYLDELWHMIFTLGKDLEPPQPTKPTSEAVGSDIGEFDKIRQQLGLVPTNSNAFHSIISVLDSVIFIISNKITCKIHPDLTTTTATMSATETIKLVEQAFCKNYMHTYFVSTIILFKLFLVIKFQENEKIDADLESISAQPEFDRVIFWDTHCFNELCALVDCGKEIANSVLERSFNYCQSNNNDLANFEMMDVVGGDVRDLMDGLKRLEYIKLDYFTSSPYPSLPLIDHRFSYNTQKFGAFDIPTDYLRYIKNCTDKNMVTNRNQEEEEQFVDLSELSKHLDDN